MIWDTIKNGCPHTEVGQAGMELAFLIAARMVLCFGFVPRTGLVTPQHFSCCWSLSAQHQGSLASSPAGGQEAESKHSRDSWPTLTRGIFCTACHRAQGKEEEAGTFMAFTFPRKLSLVPRKCLDICLMVKSSLCFAYRNSICFPCETTIVPNHEPSCLPSVFSPSHGRGEQLRGWVGAWLLARVSHNTQRGNKWLPFAELLAWANH